MSNIRELGLKALKNILNDKNSIKLEEIIFSKTNETNYIDVIYESIGELIGENKLSNVTKEISSGNFGWKYKAFNQMSKNLDEQDIFIEHPFEIAEGALECKCGSKRVYSYQNQVRSADEPMTTFAECASCKLKWKYNG